MSQYFVKHLDTDEIKVRVPGSKSITNRALMIAALANGTSYIDGILDSDDSRHFIDSLVRLGFTVNANGSKVIIKGAGGIIPQKSGEIYVGSAGTAARFLTAMLAFSDGEYTITASEQMEKRPMKDLIIGLMSVGVSFTFLKKEYSLPFIVKGIGKDSSLCELHFDINIDKSSQFLSAILLAAPMCGKRLHIRLTGGRKAKAYVVITEKMMKEFGVTVIKESDNDYVVEKEAVYTGRAYMCEPDVSAACYFYAMAAAGGISACVYDVHSDSIQGDIAFVNLLESMGCVVNDTEEGIVVKGVDRLKGANVNMSNFSDQALTLAAIAPFTDSGVCITDVAHIRGQECDRINAMYNELTRMGIKCNEFEDGIMIRPGNVKPAVIETYNDHRVAMSFAVTGLFSEGIVIDNPQCCAKTFPDYFNILDKLCQGGYYG